MAEVGLVPFAHLAREVAATVLPPYRTRFSKHQFMQPQLLAVLCLMRYEDWTYREVEVRLREHSEVASGAGVAPRARRLCRTRQPRRRRARVAVDATGLSSGAFSTFFVRRMHHHTQKPLPWRHWLKWLVVVDVDQQFLLAQAARRGPANDCALLPVLVGAASRNAHIGQVLADAEFDSERNHLHVRQQLHAESIIPAKRGKRTWRL